VRLTKYGHACVRLDLAGGSVVLDPGTYSPDVDLAGVADVLVTHEHADHIDVDRLVPLVRDGLRLHTNADVAASLASDHGLDVHAVGPGETFTVAGVDVRVVGGEHAEIYNGLPGCANVGFVLAGLYHPGDALHVPEVEVATLLVPSAHRGSSCARRSTSCERSRRPGRSRSTTRCSATSATRAWTAGWCRKAAPTTGG
jgi:L-ascorbate metabolism protein UlaG (beta-lactamase superfamily)